VKNRLFHIIVGIILVLGIIYLFREFGFLAYIYVGVSTLIIGGISFVIFMENRSPQSTLAWLLVLIFIPGIGVMIYVLFGRDVRRKKKISTFSEQEKLLHIKDLLAERYKENIIAKPYLQKIAHSIEKVGGGTLFFQTETSLLTNGEKTFSSILEAIKEAKHHIHIQYYIYRGDEIGTQLRDALIEKAKEGVTVRFLYDGFGSNGLKDRFIREMEQVGIEVCPFDPIISPWLIRTVNYRNHRKIVIVDGKVGFTGGLNVGDEYMGRSPEFGFWRDSHLRLEGEAVYKLQYIFLKDWLYATNKVAPHLKGEILEGDNRRIFFPLMKDARTREEEAVQVVSSGPYDEDQHIRNTMLIAMANAKKSIWIATPYFIPDQESLTTLRLAAKAGVDVRLLYPGRGDSKVSDYASKSYFMPLIEDGVSIYTYKENFMHAKMVLIDDEIAIIGTANMDIRSFALNHEVMVFLYESPTVQQMKEDFEEDFRVSKKIEEETFRKRALYKRLFESVCRLISPIL
jgi:cardiolipin synthase A/B